MKRNAHFLAGTLLITLCLLSTLGWTVTEAVTKKRHFEGQLAILEVVKDSYGKGQLIDEVRTDLRFDVSVLELASGAKEVTSTNTWIGRTKKGRSFSIRLGRPGAATVDLQQGILEVTVPYQVTLDGKSFELPLTLSTEKTVSGPRGILGGKRFRIQNQAARIRLVGSIEQRATEDAPGTLIVLAEGTVTALPEKSL